MINCIIIYNKLLSIILPIILSISILSCKGEVENVKKEERISLKVKNKGKSFNKNLEINIINNDDRNYFIVLDTTKIEAYSTLNYKINELIHLKPSFINDKDTININIKTAISKSDNNSTFECLKKQKIITDSIKKNLFNLKMILILEKHSTTKFSISFKKKFKDCRQTYFYEINDYKNYDFVFTYEMKESLLKQYSDEKYLSILKKKKIFPYYKKICSNKVDLSEL